MTPKERVRAILERRPVDRLAVDLWHTSEVGSALRKHFNAPDDLSLWQSLGLDKIVWVFMTYQTPQGDSAASQVGAKATGARTLWGVPLREVQAGQATYAEFASAPLAGFETARSLEQYPHWPDPERFDYLAAETAAREASAHFPVIGPWVSLFEIYCQLRGMEQAMYDLAEKPAYVDAALDRIEHIQTQMMRRYFARAASLLDLVFVSDDIGGQTGLLLSPQSWRRHLQPRMARWCRLIHEHNLRVFYHSDGGFDSLIPELIACGIDVLNPIQHVCPGMDMAALKNKYGDRLIFHGGVDNQFALPRGTADDVRRETLACLQTLGRDRAGFICCSCHNVQPGTPLENILEMVRTVRNS